jgi:glutamine synthetase
MSAPELPALVTVVTTDLAGVTRGRPLTEERLARAAETGLGWVPANLVLTAFNTIADPNPWGSTGDLRLVPDLGARFQTSATLAPTPFSMVMGDLVELDGRPWAACARTFLRDSLAALRAETGLTLIAAFEHELQLVDRPEPAAHAFSFEAMRRADPFVPQLFAALAEAGLEPELVFAEYGAHQFEATVAPAEGLTAADRAVALREITRELARSLGRRASFAPKTSLEGVGNGVHIHWSLVDAQGAPVLFDAGRPGRLSLLAGSFCAGVLRHVPALLAFTAPSESSYFRLKPHSWSASYTWLGERDREATLRICPTVEIGGRDPARQLNVEFRAADATANPYLALAVIARAGLEGIRASLPSPPVASGDPTLMTEGERERLGLRRLPETLAAALAALEADETVRGWFDADFLATILAVRRAESAALKDMTPAEICAITRDLF